MFESNLNKGIANGYAPLGPDAKIPASYVPTGTLPIFLLTGSTIYSNNSVSTGFSINNAFFVGANAGFNSTSTDYSNFIGGSAGQLASNASQSNFIGFQAGFGASDAIQSNFLGAGAGLNAFGTSYSNFLGYNAGAYASFAAYSTFLGYNVGNSAFISGSGLGMNNIIIGTNISLPKGATNSFNIGGILFGVNTYSLTGTNPSITAQTIGMIGVGVVSSAITNTLHISAISNPVRIQGLTANTGDTNVISIDATGVLHTFPISSISGGTGSTISTGSTTTFYGTVYNKSSWSNLTDFTNVGATANVVGNQIIISGGNQFVSSGTNAVYNQYLRLTGGTMLERWKFQANIKVGGAPSSTTYGFGLGTISTSDHTAGNVFNAVGYFNMTNTGSTTGTVSLLAGNSNITVGTSLTGLTFSLNDVIQFTTERVDNVIYVTAKNITTSSATVSTSYEYDTSLASNPTLPNTSNFSIVSFGGTFTIQSINITSNVIKNAEVMFVGDSKTAGYDAPYDIRYGSLVAKNISNVIVSAGASDTTQSVLNHIPEIITLAPKRVALCIGRNDDAFGVLSGTWQTNYLNIINQLTGAGITVIHLNGFYESTFSSTAVPTYINANWSPVIKTYEATHVPNTIGVDNIHPNILGHQIGANVILNDGSLGNTGYNSISPVFDSPTYSGLQIIGTLKNPNAIIPISAKTSDWIMQAGTALRSTSVLNTQQTAIVLADTNAVMTFRNYYGAAGDPTGGGFAWYTGLATLGSQTQVMALSTNGILGIGAVQHGFSTTTGDIQLSYTKAIRGASSSSAGNEGAFIPYATNGHTEIRNYQQVGQIRVFISNNVAGGQTQAFTITQTGTTGINVVNPTNRLHVSDTTDPIRIQGMTSTTADTTVISVDATGVAHTMAISSLFPSGQAALIAGTRLVSVSGITSSSKAYVSIYSANTSNNSTSWQGQCSANTLTLRANVSGGTINVADTSILNWFIIV